MDAHEKLPATINYDARLLRTRLGQFYLCTPLPLEKRPDNQRPPLTEERKQMGAGTIALDPGVRTFQTGYTPDGLVVEWGARDLSRIYRLCHHHGDLQSRWSQKDVIRHRRRYRLRKAAAARIRHKIRNLVDDLHKRLAKWLCENHETVLLPPFETSGEANVASDPRRPEPWSPGRTIGSNSAC
jgi:transposase